MLFLTDEDVKTLLPVPEAIQVVLKAFKEVGRGNVQMPPRQLTEVSEYRGLMLSMPAYIGGEIDALGQKVVTIYANNPTENNLPTILGTVQLLDPKNGSCLAVMAANALTAIRTGAASAVATEFLATENSDTIALFGVGGQAATQLEAICFVRDIRQIKVYAPTRDTRDTFLQRNVSTSRIKNVGCHESKRSDRKLRYYCMRDHLQNSCLRWEIVEARYAS